ncbi:MAG: hypothetical protein IJW18_09685 [Lachnospiraceae bacterium]|nr:hypothetical protein [Lachnospiraceae bacterium]
MKFKKGFRRDENGAIMIESLIVFGVTIAMLFFMLAIFCVMFQRWNLQTIANESAMRIAYLYRYPDVDDEDILTGSVYDANNDYSKITAIRDYRYFFYKDDLTTIAEDRLEEYAGWRLANSTFTQNVSEPKFDVDLHSDSLGRRHIEVTIKGEYAVPGGEIFSFFGFDSTTKYEVTAYAECLDIMDYMNTVDYLDCLTSLDSLDSDVIGAIDSVISVIKKFFDK